MYYFYVLYSLRDGRLYKGYTSDLGQRYGKHQTGGVRSTKHRRPLVIIYVESFVSKEAALSRERWSKSLEGGPALFRLLVENGILTPEKKLAIEVA